MPTLYLLCCYRAIRFFHISLTVAHFHVYSFYDVVTTSMISFVLDSKNFKSWISSFFMDVQSLRSRSSTRFVYFIGFYFSNFTHATACKVILNKNFKGTNTQKFK